MTTWLGLGFALLALLLLWSLRRRRTAWARDKVVTNLVELHSQGEALAQLGVVVTSRWSQLVSTEGDRADFALMLETDDKPIAARAAVTRLPSGGFTIATSLLAERKRDGARQISE
jgi:hypothetical protein